MRNPLTRLFYTGIFGLGISCALIIENYLSKSNDNLDYIIGIVLAVFSITFIISSIVIKHKRK